MRPFSGGACPIQLPVNISMGGVNAAGRTSGFQSFPRMIMDALTDDKRDHTLAALHSIPPGLQPTSHPAA